MASFPRVPGNTQPERPFGAESIRNTAGTLANRPALLFCGLSAGPFNRGVGGLSDRAPTRCPGFRLRGFGGGAKHPSFTVSFFREKVTES